MKATTILTRGAFLPASKPLMPPCAVRALRVDDGCRRFGIAPDALAPLLAQSVVHDLESPGRGPALERRIDPAPGRKALGQQAPGAARAHDVEASIDDAF